MKVSQPEALARNSTGVPRSRTEANAFTKYPACRSTNRLSLRLDSSSTPSISCKAVRASVPIPPNPNLNRFPSERFRFDSVFCRVNCLDDADFKYTVSGTDCVRGVKWRLLAGRGRVLDRAWHAYSRRVYANEFAVIVRSKCFAILCLAVSAFSAVLALSFERGESTRATTNAMIKSRSRHGREATASRFSSPSCCAVCNTAITLPCGRLLTISNNECGAFSSSSPLSRR